MGDRFPDGRTYIHDKCGKGTTISGADFYDLCDVTGPVMRTWCASCEKYASLSTVQWEDTGESVADYRKRLLNNHTPKYLKHIRIWRPALGLGLPAFVTWLAGAEWYGIAIASCVGAFIGFFVLPGLLGTMLPNYAEIP